MAVSVLAAALGSGTSSRLFQGVRERKALVYSVYTTVSQHSDSSSLATYMSCTGPNVAESMCTAASEIGKLCREGLEKGELERTKRLLKGANVRAMESTDSRLYRLGVNHMLNGSAETLEERLPRIDAVTGEDVMRTAEDILRLERLNAVVLGKKSKKIRDFDLNSLSF
jgi:predicted Zn-dependent peptidase